MSLIKIYLRRERYREKGEGKKRRMGEGEKG
jgi:hypothetical protein